MKKTKILILLLLFLCQLTYAIDITQDKSLALDRIIAVFPGGSGQIPVKKQGLTTIMVDMLKEGPQNMSPKAYRKSLFLLNASIDFSNSPRAIQLTISAPPENIKKALKLTNELLTNPSFTPKVFQTSKSKVLNNRQIMKNFMQEETFFKAYKNFFNNHPDILDGTGTINSIKNVTLKDIQTYWQKNINQNQAKYYTIGHSSKYRQKKYITKHSLSFQERAGVYAERSRGEVGVSWPAPNYPLPTKKIQIYHKPNATDNQILYLNPITISADTKEYLAGLITHQMLGGGSMGLLGEELREKRGLTYHASSFLKVQGVSAWGIYTFGGIKQTPKLLKSIPEVVHKFNIKKLEQKEIEEARQAIITIYKKATETPMDRLGRRIRHRLYGLDEKFFKNIIPNLKKIKKSDIENFRTKNLDMSNHRLYLMGDKKILRYKTD